jgi:hypothetical protein
LPISQQARFPRGAGERFFDVDVLAALHAGQRHRGVHEIGDAYGAGIDVLVFLVEHDAEVLVPGCLFEALETGRGAGLVHVAQRHDILGARGGVQVRPALGAAADGGYVELIVERLVARRPERRHAAKAAGRHSPGQQRPIEEVASRNTVVGHDLAVPLVQRYTCLLKGDISV